MYCSPSRNKQKITCYSHNSLLKIAKEYNRISPSYKIKTTNQTKLQLWKQIRNGLSNKCNNEICWIDQDFIKKMGDKEILKETFRPKMPKSWKYDPTTWLVTDDINKAMIQYEKLYNNFLFIGPLPLDCGIDTNLRCELTNFNINKIYKSGIRFIGLVYNTDTSSGPGQHWFAIFIDMAKHNDITLYDSYGAKPLPEMFDLMKKIQSDLKNGNNLNMKINWNKKRHQYDGFNCGMYSMNYIINRLKGKTLKQIENMKISTKKMQEMKKYLYRNL